MTFYVEGRNSHELMTTDKLFKKCRVDKAEEIDSSHKIIHKKINLSENNNEKLAKHLYQQVELFVAVDKSVVFPEQVMTSPVVILSPDSSVAQAFKLFYKYKFRHVPVTTSDYKLQGIISDRDVLRILGSTSEENSNSKISDVMLS
jgi:CBS domain-containing protein